MPKTLIVAVTLLLSKTAWTADVIVTPVSAFLPTHIARITQHDLLTTPPSLLYAFGTMTLSAPDANELKKALKPEITRMLNRGSAVVLTLNENQVAAVSESISNATPAFLFSGQPKQMKKGTLTREVAARVHRLLRDGNVGLTHQALAEYFDGASSPKASIEKPSETKKWTFLEPAEALRAFDPKVAGKAAAFRRIPKGERFVGIYSAENERHIVIPEDFELQATPLTWGQLLRIVDLTSTEIQIPNFARNPVNSEGGKYEKFQGGLAVNSDYPVVNISLGDSEQLIDFLNSIQNEWTYWVPEEAHWLYALGNAKGGPGNSAYGTFPVGQKKPNKFGLHDMYGLVLEWTRNSFFASENEQEGIARGRSPYEIRTTHWGRGFRWHQLGLRLARSRRDP